MKVEIGDHIKITNPQCKQKVCKDHVLEISRLSADVGVAFCDMPPEITCINSFTGKRRSACSFEEQEFVMFEDSDSYEVVL